MCFEHSNLFCLSLMKVYILAFIYSNHRHLTATNILLSAEKVAKVSNFRLTRELDYDLGDREFPVCWAPTEVLEAKVSVKCTS